MNKKVVAAMQARAASADPPGANAATPNAQAAPRAQPKPKATPKETPAGATDATTKRSKSQKRKEKQQAAVAAACTPNYNEWCPNWINDGDCDGSCGLQHPSFEDIENARYWEEQGNWYNESWEESGDLGYGYDDYSAEGAPEDWGDGYAYDGGAW